MYKENRETYTTLGMPQKQKGGVLVMLKPATSDFGVDIATFSGDAAVGASCLNEHPFFEP
jgi:hypothetical protein